MRKFSAIRALFGMLLPSTLILGEIGIGSAPDWLLF